jgi:hypothetical protein
MLAPYGEEIIGNHQCGFGPKKDKVTVEWRKLHNEELNDL